jgi:putative flavoprotein involved in K+ transport
MGYQPISGDEERQMAEDHDTVIIGGGQAGLAMSFHLRERGREHIVLERARVGERWRSERWNSLHFQFPNWSMRLPGMSYVGAEPDGFSHHTHITRFIEDYAKKIKAPVRENTEVSVLRRDSANGNYLIETQSGTIRTRNAIVATGPFQRSFTPNLGNGLPPSVYEIVAAQYRGPDELPPGAILVVGSGASGCQIADELYHSGRTVFLSVSRHRRVPRRYHGKDMFWWFEKLGRFDITIDTFPNRKYPPSTVVTGVNGGYDVDIRRFAKEGAQILGHVQGISEGKVALASDVNEILNGADKAYADFIAAADTLLVQSDLRSSLEMDDSQSPPGIAKDIETTQTLNLHEANIGAVIWATGHRFDFGWVRLPIFDSLGAPIQNRGVTSCRGVYFLGLHWMHTFKSGLLSFVGEDAAYLADYMDASSTT